MVSLGLLPVTSMPLRLHKCSFPNTRNRPPPLFFPAVRYSSREQWYAFTVAGVRVVVLDSNRDFGDQLPWFAAEVASPAWTGAAARVVFCHIPPFVEFWEVAVWKGREGMKRVRACLCVCILGGGGVNDR